MIFSNKLNKISSGKNITIYATSSNSFDLFIFNNNVKKKNLIFSDILKCISTDESFSYNYVCKLENKFMCVCLDDNMSIIKNE